MHKCIVCGITYNINRQGVIYHGDEHIGKAVVNNFKSPRRPSGLTRNNEDMSNKNMLIAEKRELVLQLRSNMAETKRNRQHRFQTQNHQEF